ANEQVALSLFLFLGGKVGERLGEHLISRAIADFVNDVLFHLGERPRLTDRGAPLRCHSGKLHLSADGEGNASLLENVAVEVDLGELLRKISAGKTTENGQRGVCFIPCAEPRFAVDVKWIDESQPAVCLFRFYACFEPPITRAIGFLNLLLRKMEGL